MRRSCEMSMRTAQTVASSFTPTDVHSAGAVCAHQALERSLKRLARRTRAAASRFSRGKRGKGVGGGRSRADTAAARSTTANVTSAALTPAEAIAAAIVSTTVFRFVARARERHLLDPWREKSEHRSRVRERDRLG
eukprot:3360122-Pleurochrysis_carterae.AAC.1